MAKNAIIRLLGSILNFSVYISMILVIRLVNLLKKIYKENYMINVFTLIFFIFYVYLLLFAPHISIVGFFIS